MLLDRMMNAVIRRGDLRITDWHGMTRLYGNGKGRASHIRIHTAASSRRISLDPDLALGECYMDGTLTCEDGTNIHDFLTIAMENTSGHTGRLFHKLMYKSRMMIKRLDQHNTLARSKGNVAHHYDLSGQLYDLFLDVDRQYSCAYFETPDASLEQAQLAKKRHLVAKLAIKPGMKVLDIGSGWGGLALYIAELTGADVTGATLSEEQFKLSNERVSQRGLNGRVRFLRQDYRSLEQKFDRIVSVGMFEHVGVGHYREFFGKMQKLLVEDGVTLLHSINRSDGPGATSAWIKKYIFPGGYIPSLSEVMPQIEEQGLYVSDIEILRLHYAETLLHWRQRFADNRRRARELYDERFCRMWEFYLSGSELAFRFGGMNNFQIQMVRNQSVLPMTRDYIQKEEARLSKLEAGNRHLRMVQKG